MLLCASTEARVAKNARRAKGYGFVTCATAEDVHKAVSALHHTELEGRQLNVEAAREREPLPEGEEAPRRARKPRKPSNRRRQEGEGDEEEQEGVEGEVLPLFLGTKGARMDRVIDHVCRNLALLAVVVAVDEDEDVAVVVVKPLAHVAS